MSGCKCGMTVVAVALMTFSAGAPGARRRPDTAVVAPVADTPVKVEVRKTADGKWELLRGGKPYFVKGVGGDYSREVLVADGGNSIRLWGVDANTRKELDEDEKQGVTVALGYWVGHKTDGFKADDPATVKRQLEEFKQVVRTYRNHPAVLVWAIGNEMETGNDTPALWASVEDLAKAAHELDPNHPTMTVIAEVGGSKVANLHKYCPDIDIVGINSYAGGQNVGDRYLKQVPAGTAKPYIITEFGPPGQWEYWSRTAVQGAQRDVEHGKGDVVRNSYQKTVLGHPGECLGSYAFYLGQQGGSDGHVVRHVPAGRQQARRNGYDAEILDGQGAPVSLPGNQEVGHQRLQRGHVGRHREGQR